MHAWYKYVLMIEYSYVPGTAARVVYRVCVYCVVPVLHWKESRCAKRSWHDILQQNVLVLLIAYPTRLLMRLSCSDAVRTYTGTALYLVRQAGLTFRLTYVLFLRCTWQLGGIRSKTLLVIVRVDVLMLMSSDVMRCSMFVRNPDTWQPGSLSCEYDRLNSLNSTLQAAWYITYARWTCIFYISSTPEYNIRKKHIIRTCLMYHAACKVEYQPFKRSYSPLTCFNFL